MKSLYRRKFGIGKPREFDPLVDGGQAQAEKFLSSAAFWYFHTNTALTDFQHTFHPVLTKATETNHEDKVNGRSKRQFIQPE